MDAAKYPGMVRTALMRKNLFTQNVGEAEVEKLSELYIRLARDLGFSLSR